MEILKLIPVCKNYIWGGMKLKEVYGKQTDLSPVAESWELSFHPDGPTRVEGGRALADAFPHEAWGENCARFDRFPMLIKFIDAAQNLSVQVHPSDAYALEQENSYGKTEAWYVVGAEPGAGLYVGFRRDVSREEYEKAIKQGTLTELLNFYEVKPGECYFIPAGTIHAIGAGCLVCEVQQNSNLTYRVFDYDRRDKNGNPRELHVEKALDVVRPFTDAEVDAIRYEARDDRDGVGTLAHCRYFRTERLTADPARLEMAGADSFHALLCVAGAGEILCGEERYAVQKGECWFIPAKTGEYTLAGDMQIIRASL